MTNERKQQISEDEIERVVEGIAPTATRDEHDDRSAAAERAAYEAFAYTNTKAVSIDKIIEVVDEWLDCYGEDIGLSVTMDYLRERLSKLNTTSP